MWGSTAAGLPVSVAQPPAVRAKMPSLLGLKCLGKLCSSEKSKVTSSEGTGPRGSYRRRLVVKDVSVTGSPFATITHLLYLHPVICCSSEHLLNNFDPLGK